ncbi:hypothetical protein [Pseudomonas sp.]|uniref:hypothetical protein n=1 Tax=Pseudomonas sp. TaxID=306 RepID=UPI003CC5A1B2
MKNYPLEIESVGGDTYIVMSRGHHDLEEFMAEATKEYSGWFLGGPKHMWCKTTPVKGGWLYNFVNEGARGAWPATYCWEFGDDYKRYNAEVTP